MPGPVFLQNERVSLRSPEKSDVPFLREYAQHPQIRETRSTHAPTDAEWAQRRVGGSMGRDGSSLGLLICVEDEPVGFVYLIREQPNADLFRLGELAYWVVPSEQGNGYATAAGRLVAAHAFDELGLHRLEASVVDANDGSKRVLEKLGFEQEGVARRRWFTDGEWKDEIQYGLLAEEYRG